MAAALWPWSQFMQTGNPAVVAPAMVIGAIGGLVLALIISFKATTAPYLVLPYAALEGLVLGGISAILEKRYPGIAIQATALTFGVLAALLVAYKARLIQATQRFRSIVIGGTLAIALLYVVVMVLNLFHVATPFMYDSSPLSIGLSLLVVRLCGAESGARFRSDRVRRRSGGAALHGVVWRLRPAGHAGVAVHGDPAVAE